MACKLQRRIINILLTEDLLSCTSLARADSVTGSSETRFGVDNNSVDATSVNSANIRRWVCKLMLRREDIFNGQLYSVHESEGWVVECSVFSRAWVFTQGFEGWARCWANQREEIKTTAGGTGRIVASTCALHAYMSSSLTTGPPIPLRTARPTIAIVVEPGRRGPVR